MVVQLEQTNQVLKILSDTSQPINIFGWLGKERDQESGLGDHTSTSLSDRGVRKYDGSTGRFFSMAPLSHAWVWEKYLGWTPYQYAGNNPVKNVDVINLQFVRF